MNASGGVLPKGSVFEVEREGREQLIPLSDPMPAQMVEVETMLNGGDRVIISYELLAKMLTDLGYELPSDYDI